MDKFFANTQAIITEINTLNTRKQYYNSKKNAFPTSGFGASSVPGLSNYLKKIQNNYESISNNASEVSLFLEDYKSDIEGIEYNLSNRGGGIKASAVRNTVMRYRNSLKNVNIKNEDIFPLNNFTVQGENPTANDFLSFMKTTDKNFVGQDLTHQSFDTLFSKDNVNNSYEKKDPNQIEKESIDILEENFSDVTSEEMDLENITNEEFQIYIKNYQKDRQFEIEGYEKVLEEIEAEINQLDTLNYNFQRRFEQCEALKTEAENFALEKINIYKNYNCPTEKLQELGITYTQLQNMEVEKLLNVCIAKDTEISKLYQEANLTKMSLEEEIKKTTKISTYEEFSNHLSSLKSDKALLEVAIKKTEELKNYAEYSFIPMLKDYQDYTYEKATISDLKTKDISPLERFRTLNEHFSRYNINIERKGEIENLLRASLTMPELAKMYNYIYDTEGLEGANKYLDAVESIVNQENGRIRAEKFLNSLEEEINSTGEKKEITLNNLLSVGIKSLFTPTNKDALTALENHLKVSGKGLGDGAESFLDGLAAWFKSSNIYTENEYETMYILKALQSDTKFDMLLDNNYEISQSIGNMIPSVVISTLLTPMAGTISMGISAGGNSYHGALVEGYGKSNAIAYGVLSGLSEAALEKLMGGIFGISDVDVTGLKTFFQNMGKEGFEEFTQEYVDDFMRKGIFNEDIDGLDTTKNAVKSFIYGGITAGIMNSPKLASVEINKGIKPNEIVNEAINTTPNNKLNVTNNINENIKTIKLEDLKYNKHGLIESVSKTLESNLKKYVYKDTNQIQGLNEKILQEGLYHFTVATDKIIDSGYIKPSGINASYGNPKTFFFNGVPEVGAFATNLDTIPLTTTAIKVNPTKEIVNSSKLKVRSLDDGAISFDGKFDLTNQSVSKEFFVLSKVNDELVYKSVSEEVYNNYANTEEGYQLQEFLKDKKNIRAIKDDYLSSLFNLNSEKNTFKIENIKKSIGRVSKALAGTTLGIKDKKLNIGMYDMTFETTDKKIDSAAIKNILDKVKVDTDNYNIKFDADENMILDLDLNQKFKNKINQKVEDISSKMEGKNLNETPIQEKKVLQDQIILNESEQSLENISMQSKETETIQKLTEEWHKLNTVEEQEIFILKILDFPKTEKEIKSKFLNDLIESGEYKDLSNGIIYHMTKDYNTLKKLIGTEKLNDLVSKNIEEASDIILPIFQPLTIEEFNQVFNSDEIKTVFNDMSYNKFVEVVNNFQKNNLKFEYIISNATFMNKLSSLSSENFNRFIQSYGYDIGKALRSLSESTGIPESYDIFLDNVAEHIYTEQYLMKYPEFRNNIPYLLSGFEVSNHKTVASIKLTETFNKINDILNQNIKNNSLISIDVTKLDAFRNGYKTNVEKLGWYDVEVELFGKVEQYTIKALKPFLQGSNYVNLDSIISNRNFEQACINGEAKIKSITWNERKSTLYFENLSKLVKVSTLVDGKPFTKVFKTIIGNLDLTEFFKENQKIENIQITEIKSYNKNIDSSDNNIYKLKGISNGEKVDLYIKTDGRNLNTLAIDELVVKYNLYDLHDVQIEKVSLQDSDTSVYNIMKYNNANQIFNSNLYGGDQSNVRILFTADSISKIDSLKVEDMKKIMKQYYPNITEAEMIKLVSRYENVGCNFMALSNALITYFANMENGNQIFKERFGYDLYYEENGIKNYNFETIALEIFLSYNHFSNITDFCEQASGVNKANRESRFKEFLESKGIKSQFSDINFNKKYSDAIIDMLQCSKDLNTFYFMYSSNFDLECLNESLSLSSDGALQDATIDGSMYKKIGDHAMLITDFNQEGEFTVSSWNRKFKFLKDSLEIYKAENTYLTIDSITFSLE